MNRPETVLSLYGGLGLLDSAFTRAGFLVARGPDLLDGHDIREFEPPCPFIGAIAGSPCQDFSDARRNDPTGEGVELLREFARCVTLAGVSWWLLENVRRVPTLHITGYTTQRILANNSHLGGSQHRLRCIQFGSTTGESLRIPRTARVPRCVTPTLTSKSDVTIADAYKAQGYRDPLLRVPRYRAMRALANGVPRALADALASAVRHRVPSIIAASDCGCGCGLTVEPPRTLATAACRQRHSRRCRGLSDTAHVFYP